VMDGERSSGTDFSVVFREKESLLTVELDVCRLRLGLHGVAEIIVIGRLVDFDCCHFCLSFLPVSDWAFMF